MTTLAEWIGYGCSDEHNRNKRLVRSWLLEARGHLPVIDRVKYPGISENHDPVIRRSSRRG